MKCEEVLSIFPESLREAVESLRPDPEKLQEIRVRAERPVFVLCGGREYVTGKCMTGVQVGEILAYLSDYSLYAYENEIRQGYLSLPGGHRVGLAGRTILEERRLKTITDVSSLNIRFAHEAKGCADPVLPYLWEGDRLCHTLIVSAPGMGKTTLLRDCIRQISDGSRRLKKTGEQIPVGQRVHPGMTVGVVDERSEIAGCYHGIPGNDVGIRTDVLDGCPKSEGLMMLIRSMAPQVVAVDEIGSREDLEALQYAMHCGCVLLATVHGSTMQELERKPVLKEMLRESMFERYILLEAGSEPGQIGRILDRERRQIWGRTRIC